MIAASTFPRLRTHLSFALCLSVLGSFSLSTNPVAALDLGLGAQVLRGTESKTTMQQVADLRQRPEVKEAFFLVTTPEEAEAVCQLTQLEKLKLTLNRLDRTPYPGMPHDEQDKKKKTSDSTEVALNHLSNLKNLRELDLGFLVAKQSPDGILKAVSMLPNLTHLSLYWSTESFVPNSANPVNIMLPAMPALTWLKLSGSSCTYQFDKAFPLEHIQYLECDAQIPEQTEFHRLTNLRTFKEPAYKSFSFTEDGLKALPKMQKLEEFSGRDAATLPLSSWREMKILGLLGVGSPQIEQISGLPRITELSLTIHDCTDTALSKLRMLKNLQKLTIKCETLVQAGKISRTPVSATGSGLSALAACHDLTQLNIDGVPVSQNLLSTVGKLSSLKSLNVSDFEHKVTPDQAKLLNNLTYLESVWIPFPPKQKIEVLRQLTGWTHLKTMFLDREDLTDSEADVLLQFPEIETLYAQQNKLTDVSLKTIARLKALKTVKLGENPIAGTTLDLVATMPQLTELDLNQTNIADEELLKHPISSNSIKTLDLSGTKIKGPGLSALSGLTALENLGLAGTLITDDQLPNLHNNNLQAISVAGTEITEHGIEKLSRLPNLKTVTAHGCGIKFGTQFPKTFAVASQIGWYDYDYDSDQARQQNNKLNEALIRIHLGKGKISELDHFQRAEMYKAIGEYKLSCAEYDQVIDDLLHPKYYVCSLMATGHTHRVFECYDGRGMALAASGDYEKALDDLNKAVEIARASAYARAHRGYVYLKLGKFDDALLDLNRAVDINPKLAAAYKYRSELYNTLGKHELAVADEKTSQTLGFSPEFGAAIQEAKKNALRTP